ncbi:acyl-CoA dehydrogenase family protein [Acidomonas methanolica]|uniref:acyl-CoA dehydrogenase family protein n=1 Tax=Acidomonas methanolica TaxID=437 RepID=UPI002119E80A|nr:acyl-CoA dehydrogenase family protein [Acidomonas methanolica]MCQ9156660.1 acyl-CoA/acyl-ACP dehydrogenase [Acidomonas methanolica]
MTVTDLSGPDLASGILPETLIRTLDRLAPRLAARAAEHDRSGTIATETLAALREAGFLTLALPATHGGKAIGLGEITAIIGRIARDDPSTALILAMHYLQTGAIARGKEWSPAVKDEIFAGVVTDGALINALRVEPELGTPARGGLPATVLRREGDRFLLTGRKIFSTGSTALRWGVVWSRTDEADPRVGPVLARLDQPGVHIEESWDQLGMRATASHTVIFEDAEIPERHIGISAAAADAQAISLASWHAVVIAALYDGIARAARDWLLHYLHERVPANLGAPLASLPRFHVLLGEIDGLLLSNRALIDRALLRERSGAPGQAEPGLIKHLVTENAIEAVGKAVAAIGNPGLSRNNPLERHYRDVLCGRIHTPQGDSVMTAAGRSALGL